MPDPVARRPFSARGAPTRKELVHTASRSDETNVGERLQRGESWIQSVQAATKDQVKQQAAEQQQHGRKSDSLLVNQNAGEDQRGRSEKQA